MSKNNPAASLQILVVDDNLIHRRMAQTLLSAMGHVSLLADSGAQALTLFAKRPPDVVLLDVHMPGMDGFETCRRLRALPGGKAMPILFLTDVSDLDSADQAFACGADDFLNKPINQIELQMRIRSLLRIRHGEARVAVLFERAGEAICALSADGVVTQWNRQATELLGWPAEEASGHKIGRFIPTLSEVSALEDLLRPASSPDGDPRAGRFVAQSALRKNGSALPVDLSLIAIRTGSDTTIYGFIRAAARS